MKKFKLLSLISLLVVSAIPFLSGCGGDSIHQYVNDCKLTSSIEYTKNTFLDNGIGEVTLKKTVDGDTAHFYQKEVDTDAHKSSRVVKVRFLGIDTPESTGKIEPWGKKASKFTSGKLLEAKTIVLTVDITNIGKPAQFDSTGTRYVGFVWVSEKENCPMNELKLLNLWVVQEGYSNAKSVSDSPLAQYFIDADMQAQKLKLGQWQGDDPDYDKGMANPTDLKTVIDSYADEGEDCPWIDSKIAVEGVVYKVVGTDCYINDWVTDPVTKETAQYGLFIFAGYKNYKPLKTVGNRIKVIGNFTIFSGNPQLTNVSYDSLHPTQDNMEIISKDNPVNIPETDFSTIDGNKTTLNRIITVKNLTCTRGYDEVDQTTEVASGAMTIYCVDDNENKVTFRVPEDVWVMDENNKRVTTWEYFKQDGLVFDVTGAVNMFESSSGNITYQLKLTHKNDITIRFE